MTTAIETEVLGGTLIVRFVRPEIRNPLSIEVLEALHLLLNHGGFERLIFTGSGGVFASGANIREIANVKAEDAREFALRGQSLMTKIGGVSSIAAINGICFGGALDLALACRLRIASRDAAFAHPGANLGIITGWGGTQRLPRLIGEGRALEMLFTARRIEVKEALVFGLIDEIADDPLEAALMAV
jgi:enoyl-CoA hydratase